MRPLQPKAVVDGNVCFAPVPAVSGRAYALLNRSYICRTGQRHASPLIDHAPRDPAMAAPLENFYTVLMARSTVFLSGNQYEKVADYGANPGETREFIERFTEGQCAMLSERIYQITGWPMVTLRDRGITIHWFNRRDDGALVDAHGAVPSFLKLIIERRHEVTVPSWHDWNCRFHMEEEDVAEVDDFLNGPWMMAVIPPEDRLPIPLPRHDIDEDEDEREDDVEDEE